MALGGISGILLTAPLTSAEALDRLRRLLLRGADVSVTADHPGSVAPLSAIATATGRTVPVLVDIDVGMGRTGCRTIDDVVDLARKLAGAPGLKFSGIQAYWGNLQQVMPFCGTCKAHRRAARTHTDDDRRAAFGRAKLRHRYRRRHRQPSHRCRVRPVHRNAARLLPVHGFLLRRDQHFGKRQSVRAVAVRRGNGRLGQPPRQGHGQCGLEGLCRRQRQARGCARRASQTQLPLHGRRAWHVEFAGDRGPNWVPISNS